MKKTTLIFILVVFVSSIMLVNFFGLNYKVYDKYQYVETIEIVNITESPGLRINKQLTDRDGTLMIYVSYERGFKERTGKDQLIMITPRCLPDNANDKQVNVLYDEKKKSAYYFEEDAPVPTLIYKDVPSQKNTDILTFKIQDVMTKKVEVKIKLITQFVDEILD